MKVLLADKLSGECREILEEAGFEVEVRPGLSPDELKEAIRGCAGCIVRSGAKLTADVLSAADCLKAICRAGVGVDNIDVAEATRRGVLVMNTPGGNTLSTAEHTMALILGLSRKIGPAYISMRAGRWDRKQFMGTQLAGKTLGIVGLGRIGRAVARRALAFEMKVIGLDPFITHELAGQIGVDLCDDLDELLRSADYITVHVPKTDKTVRLIGADEVRKMKSGAKVINCARGGIVDQRAVMEAVNEGRLGGAAFDVYESEPPEDFGIAADDRILCTPHLGASTEEAQAAVSREAAQQMVDALLDRSVRNALNLLSIPSEDAESLRPYCELSMRLGKLLAQRDIGRISELEVVLSGEIAGKNIRLLQDYCVVGLMRGTMEESVNLVNAPMLARERGIKIRSVTTEIARGFSSLVQVNAKGENGAKSVAGTVFGQSHPRIVQVDDFYVEIVPEGSVLLIFGKDIPGLIGGIGSLLGGKGINIARMGFGRESAGGRALVALNLDCAVTDEVIGELVNMEPVEKTCSIEFPELPGEKD